jgi:integrase
MTKTEDGMRDLPISDALYEELSAWRKWFGTDAAPTYYGRSTNTGGYLFILINGSVMSHSGGEKLWARIRNIAAEFDPEYANSHNFTPHVLRHTFITRLFEAGLDIKEVQILAGHKDPTVTLRVYTHYDRRARQQDTFQAVRDAMARKDSSTGDKIIDFPGSVNFDDVAQCGQG